MLSSSELCCPRQAGQLHPETAIQVMSSSDQQNLPLGWSPVQAHKGVRLSLGSFSCMVLCFRTFCLLLQSTSSASFRVLSRQHPLICSRSLSKFVTYRAAARHQFSSPKCPALIGATFCFRGHGTLVQVTHGHAPICRLLPFPGTRVPSFSVPSPSPPSRVNSGHPSVC